MASASDQRYIQDSMLHPFAKFAIPAAILAAGAAAVHLFQPVSPAMSATTSPATRPSLEAIRLRGFGMTQDSLTLALQAASQSFGQSSDYDTLYALSGGAFAPALDVSEDCRSWWHVKASMGAQRLSQLAQSLRLSATPLATPAPSQNDAQFYRDSAPLIRETLAEGSLVLAEGGFDEVGGWDWAGVITHVKDDGTVTGITLSAATVEGKIDVPLRYARRLWKLRPDAAEPPTAQAIARDTLAVAIRRIRGQNEFEPAGERIYGLEAMDHWIRQMASVRGFCKPCFSRAPVPGVHDAPDNDGRMFEAAKVASRRLNAIAAAFPAEQAGHVQQAAACYDRIAHLLAPAAEGRFSYDSLSSLDAQRQYARDVLEPIKTELTWAAVHLERALILADGGKLLPAAIAAYDPIARAYPDMNPVRSDLLMREVLLKSAGIQDIAYDDLVMLAGFGTTFAYHPQRYYYAYEAPDNPKVTEERLCEGSGARLERRPKPASPEDAWNLVKHSIDSGRPLQASWLDDFIIAGYVDSTQPQRREIYAMGKWSIAQRMNWAEWALWYERFGQLASIASAPSPKGDLSRVILERIVYWGANDNRHLVEFMKEGKFSFPGMEAYAADIADATKRPEDFDGAWLACHAINRQWASRVSASRYLERMAAKQIEPARERLQHAANLYARSYNLWRQFRMTLGGDDAVGKWQNPKARKLGAELLREAIELEKQAIADIAAALPAISSKQPSQEQR